ncbi:putative uncharacterized protein FLJ37770 [Centruroides sculpturatus]|uniref:putative uncharacterized protein FLJ37770 n=1 Tax=Centruroides sculpturatus TaxID=218467 RepID=UPI000C6DE879|nr:putative uncharacterized protein FLJ37770 [Centruroides sculpturatus]
MEASKVEQRGVIRFLVAEGCGPTAIHRRMQQVYGPYTISLAQVKVWVKKFKEGLTSLKDKQRSGRPQHAATSQNVQMVEDLMLANRQIKLRDIAAATGLSFGTVHKIVHKHLNFSKVCAQWVPHSLNEEQKTPDGLAIEASQTCLQTDG